MKAALSTITKMRSAGDHGSDLFSLSVSLSRIGAGLAMHALAYVDFHRMDDELGEGKLDPRLVPVVKMSVVLASPEFFPEAAKHLASELKKHLASFAEALARGDLEKSKSESHAAHELYHELHTKVADWLELQSSSGS